MDDDELPPPPGFSSDGTLFSLYGQDGGILSARRRFEASTTGKAATLLHRLLESQEEMLKEGRATVEKEECCAYFPKFGEDDSWPLFPDWEAVKSLEGSASMDGEMSWDLFEASILLGYRLTGSPGQFVQEAPAIFTKAIIQGDLDPRDPHTDLPFSIGPADLLFLAKGEQRGIDMHWRVWPRDLNEFALKYWHEAIFTDAELNGDWRKPSVTEKDRPTDNAAEQPRPRTEATLYGIIRALTFALAETDPKRFKKNGRPLPGCFKPGTVSGIIGHLKEHEFSDQSTSTLEKHIGASLKD